ncbi:MAG TPA: hypothetical protein VND22_03090 [Actinomycetota bacterium]|nr:hypothetical protein [Actinomycetota bacterium]
MGRNSRAGGLGDPAFSPLFRFIGVPVVVPSKRWLGTAGAPSDWIIPLRYRLGPIVEQ